MHVKYQVDELCVYLPYMKWYMGSRNRSGRHEIQCGMKARAPFTGFLSPAGASRLVEVPISTGVRAHGTDGMMVRLSKHPPRNLR